MQAVYIESHGGPEVLTYGERPDPQVGEGEVKLKVRATALNRLDLYTREGGRGLQREFPPPLILGGDCAGEIAEVGAGVNGLKEGDRVIVNPRLSCQQCPACSGRSGRPLPQVPIPGERHRRELRRVPVRSGRPTYTPFPTK